MKKKIVGYSLALAAIILFGRVNGDGIRKTEANFASTFAPVAEKDTPCDQTAASVSLWDVDGARCQESALEEFGEGAGGERKPFGRGKGIAGLQEWPDGAAVSVSGAPEGVSGLMAVLLERAGVSGKPVAVSSGMADVAEKSEAASSGIADVSGKLMTASSGMEDVSGNPEAASPEMAGVLGNPEAASSGMADVAEKSDAASLGMANVPGKLMAVRSGMIEELTAEAAARWSGTAGAARMAAKLLGMPAESLGVKEESPAGASGTATEVSGVAAGAAAEPSNVLGVAAGTASEPSNAPGVAAKPLGVKEESPAGASGTASEVPDMTAAPTAPGPSNTPDVTAAPTVEPEPSNTPDVTAAPTEGPEETPGVTAEPTLGPSGTPGVTAEPTAGPSGTPGVTAEPTASPSVSPEPTAKPTTKPTAKPTPKPTVKPTPKPDMGLQVKQKKNNITLRWKGGNGAAYYKVWKKSPGKRFRSVKKLKQKKHTITVAAASANTVKVTAYNKKGKKLAESEKVRIVIPAKMWGVNCTYWGNNKVKLSWSKCRKTDLYRIYRKSINEKEYHLLNTSKKLSWTDEKVKRKKIYQYKIVPVKVCDKISFVGETNARKRFSHEKIVATGRQEYSYQEMSEDIKELREKFPSQLHYDVIGYSEDGRAIYDVIVGNQYASKSLLVVSTIHAREYMASLLSMNQIEYYLENYHEEFEAEKEGEEEEEEEKEKQKVSQVFSKIAVHYVTMANPDGAMISQKGLSAIRNKDLRKKLKKMAKGFDLQLWKANARGVDLNRNFAVNFKKSGKAGAMGYSGKKAHSEKESQAIVSLLDKLRGKGLQGVVNYHATGSIIFGGGPYADDEQQEKTTQMYELAKELTGYGSSASYESQTGSGNGLREFIMLKKNTPSITLEIGKLPCPGPISEFKHIWEENKDLVFREALLFL